MDELKRKNSFRFSPICSDASYDFNLESRVCLK